MCPAPSLGGHAKAVTQLPEEGRVVLPAGQVPPGTTQIQNHGGGSAPTRPAKPKMTFLLLGPLRAGEQTGQAVLGSCPGSGPTTHACPRKQASGCRTTRGHPFKAPPQMLLAGAPQCGVMVGGAEHQAHAAWWAGPRTCSLDSGPDMLGTPRRQGTCSNHQQAKQPRLAPATPSRPPGCCAHRQGTSPGLSRPRARGQQPLREQGTNLGGGQHSPATLPDGTWARVCPLTASTHLTGCGAISCPPP